MIFQLRKKFSKSFRLRVWKTQFPDHLVLKGGDTFDPYGNRITFEKASLDHIIPIKFFNKHLAEKENPMEYYARYKMAANCIENLQFLDSSTNLNISYRTKGKLTRHGKTVPELIRILNYRYSLDI